MPSRHVQGKIYITGLWGKCLSVALYTSKERIFQLWEMYCTRSPFTENDNVAVRFLACILRRRGGKVLYSNLGRGIGNPKILRGLPNFVQTNAGIVPGLRHDHLLPNPYQFIIHQSYHHWRYLVWDVAASCPTPWTLLRNLVEQQAIRKTSDNMSTFIEA